MDIVKFPIRTQRSQGGLIKAGFMNGIYMNLNQLQVSEGEYYDS